MLSTYMNDKNFASVTRNSDLVPRTRTRAHICTHAHMYTNSRLVPQCTRMRTHVCAHIYNEKITNHRYTLVINIRLEISGI